MGPKSSRSSEPPGAAPRLCPTCASSDATVAYATQTTVYLLCRSCEHVWQAGRTPLDVIEANTWTSMAFRITRRRLTRPPN